MVHSCLLQTLLKDFTTASLPQTIRIDHLTLDSRTVGKNTLFLAVLGESNDGRNYIAEALKKGAAAVVYEAYSDHDPWAGYSGEVPLIAIPKLKSLVGVIASCFYQHPSKQMTVIGVTGTNGKTSCTHFIAQVLNSLQIKSAVIGTIGYGFPPHLNEAHLTTPDPIEVQKNLFDLKNAGAEVVAMEVSSHSLVQHRVAGVQFKIAVFTHLSRDHLDYHGDMESYAKAKELLFQIPDLEYGVVNLDDDVGRRILNQYQQSIQMLAYSAAGKTDLRFPMVYAENITQSHSGFTIQVNTSWGSGEFSTQLLGRFNVSNLLAVLGVLGLLKIPLPKILRALGQLQTVPGRMQRFGGEKQPLIVVDYSHTPDSLEKGLMALREHCEGKLTCVFGCGGDRDRGKRSQMASIAEQLSDEVIVTNDNPRTEDPQQIAADILRGLKNPQQIKVILDREKAIEYAIQTAGINDIVLVAGKGHEDYQIIGREKRHFSDAEEVKKQLQLRESNR